MLYSIRHLHSSTHSNIHRIWALFVVFPCVFTISHLYLANSKKRKAEDNKDSEPSKKQKEEASVFIGNLPYTCTEEALQEAFEGEGIEPESVRIITDTMGKSRGFGYAEFKEKKLADACVKANVEVEGRALRFDHANGKPNRTAEKTRPGQNTNEIPSRLLMLKNLSFSVSKEDIDAQFDGASDVRVLTDRDTGLSRGMAFVEFKNTEEATAARKEMNGQQLDGRELKIVFATPKEDFDKDAHRSRGGRGGGFRGGRGGGGRGGGFRGGRGGGGRGGGFRGGRGGGFRGGRGGRGGGSRGGRGRF